MGRLGEKIRRVLGTVLACGMGVQILLGIAWLIKNIGGLQTFQESMALLQGGDGKADLYSGVLYQGLARLFSSRLWLLYGLQLAAAFAAGYALMACLTDRQERLPRLLGALSLLTIPQVLQCHLAVLPWSLGTSLLMGEAALWLRIRAGGAGAREKREIAGMLAGWLLLALILPAYACFALPLLIAALWHVAGNAKGGGRLACGLAALAVCLGSVTASWGWSPAAWNRSLAASALSRVGWPYFQELYDDIPEPLHSDIGLTTAREVSAYADGVKRTLIPKLEQAYNPEEVTDALWELTGLCLERNSRAAAKNVIWDMAAYHATPPILAMQLRGRAYDAYSGVSYQQMKNRAPLLTRYYVTYASRWWWLMLALAVALWAVSHRRGRGGAWLRCALPVLVCAEWMILSSVLAGSGIMDYKRTLLVTVLWYVAALSALASRRERKMSE